MSGSLLFNFKEFLVFLDDCKIFFFRFGDWGGKFGDDFFICSLGRK